MALNIELSCFYILRVYSVPYIPILWVQWKTRAFVACVSERTKKIGYCTGENYQLEVRLAIRVLCVGKRKSRAKDPSVSFHRFPADPVRRDTWLHVFQAQVKPHTRICCRHFPGADVRKDPQVNLGKRFASPKKKGTPKAKCVKGREEGKHLSDHFQSSPSVKSATPTSIPRTTSEILLTPAIGEPLDSD